MAAGMAAYGERTPVPYMCDTRRQYIPCRTGNIYVIKATGIIIWFTQPILQQLSLLIRHSFCLYYYTMVGAPT
jgi:hypothetical protein